MGAPGAASRAVSPAVGMRRIAAIAAAKAAAAVSRRLRLGGGTALPGLLAERIDPGLVAGMAARLGHGSVLVTGTNGKTTTARLLRNILAAAGLRPVANRAGSNMMRGVAAALAEASGWRGRMDGEGQRAGVFEVDEATMPAVASRVNPRAIVFTNLFRDQLDRYGEVERVASLWQEAVARLPESVVLVLNADDPSVSALGAVARGPVVYYGLDGGAGGRHVLEHAADARWCTACGAELAYRVVFYGHIGHWECPRCGLRRPACQVTGRSVALHPGAVEVEISLPGGCVRARLPLAGLYNAYNALAAVAGASALGIGQEHIEEGLAATTAAFGRQERVEVSGRTVHILLAKNPAGLNQVLETVAAGAAPLNVAIFLNDGLADGRDISWIWDVDFERLSGKVRRLTVSGTRAWDLALRLKYAGLDPWGCVEPSATKALRRALASVPAGEPLYVIPTYTAMLQVRDILARWAGKPGFWEEE